MIRAESNEGETIVHVSGDAPTVLHELLTTISQVLNAFYAQGCADVVMQGLVDVAAQFASSINDTNFNSKGEERK